MILCCKGCVPESTELTIYTIDSNHLYKWVGTEVYSVLVFWNNLESLLHFPLILTLYQDTITVSR